MKQVQVLIAGGGPVGMTLACELAQRGIKCMLVERNAETTRHPKMDITNARSMELFRRLGLVDTLRRVAVPEGNNFDVSWITSLSGHELHRFRYPSVTEWRRMIRDQNDGSMPGETCRQEIVLAHPTVGSLVGRSGRTPRYGTRVAIPELCITR
jgi:hypothetical protein